MAGYKKIIAAVFSAAFLLGSAGSAPAPLPRLKIRPRNCRDNLSQFLNLAVRFYDAPERCGTHAPDTNSAACNRSPSGGRCRCLLAVCAIVLVFVAYMYRRDSVELKPGVGVLLAMLRLAAFGGVLLMFLDMQKRIPKPKSLQTRAWCCWSIRALSMSRADADETLPNGKGNTAGNAPGTFAGQRIDQVAMLLPMANCSTRCAKLTMWKRFEFDSDVRRVATLPEARANHRQNNRGSDRWTNPANGSCLTKIDWQKELEPQGAETRIGQAVRQIINDERGVPLSAIVLFSDGGQNAGVDVSAAIKAAQEAKVPVEVVGLGSATRPRMCGSAIWSPRPGLIRAIVFK